MFSAKYVGLDVHQATTSAAVIDKEGRVVMESVLETKASTILGFIHGLRGDLAVTFEEGTWATWLYDLLKPQVAKLVVCDPRRNALLKTGNKNDKIDARKLADLLRAGLLIPVYHGEGSLRDLRELVRVYLALTQDATRVMSRIKALYRSWAVPCAGERVYSVTYREQSCIGHIIQPYPPTALTLAVAETSSRSFRVVRQKYVVSAAFDLAVTSHADADKLLRTEPQVRLTNLHLLSMQSVSNHHANNFGARIDTIPKPSA